MAHLQARIAQHLSTEPADCERVERGIAACYRFTGRKPPKSILWIDSPAAMVAGPIAAGVIEYWARGWFVPESGRVGEAVEECVRPYIAGSVPENVVDLVRMAVGSDFDPSTCGESSAINFSAGDANHTIALRDACGNAVTEEIRAAIGVAFTAGSTMRLRMAFIGRAAEASGLTAKPEGTRTRARERGMGFRGRSISIR
ncbi:MAG: hypothetical protein IAI50_13310 [Candidatus Eremiobacteraeota bacterium]|nr:hypothetical protein [Candidatus Eremiobacteraeota bacterium]